MSGLVAGCHRIAVFKSCGGVEVETYQNELQAVIAMINNGSLGSFVNDRRGWGSEGHKAALNAVEAHIKKVREAIAEQEAEDMLGGPDESDFDEGGEV